MIKKVKNFDKIKNSNLFFILEEEKDLEKISFLDLSENILSDLKSKIEKKETWIFEYFMWLKNFSKLYIFLNLDDSKNLDYTLWKEMNRLDKNITVLSNSSQNVET